MLRILLSFVLWLLLLGSSVTDATKNEVEGTVIGVFALIWVAFLLILGILSIWASTYATDAYCLYLFAALGILFFIGGLLALFLTAFVELIIIPLGFVLIAGVACANFSIRPT
jgi:peptidoglycan/LPS O-acetylase OafA/YrhL